MSDLKDRLARLGLSQYHQVFAAEGFDTWDTLGDITESDLSYLNVKLGHRRKLQRAILESRGQSSYRPLPSSSGRANSVDKSYRSDDSGTESRSKQGEPTLTGASGSSTKRKYRRHPKPDEHAPERPPSAYVIFSNQVRESLKGQDFSFAEIAKVVGEKWQVVPADEREACERQASSAKEKYYTELAEYKKTTEFEVYQKYLEDFKSKHAAPTKGKRSKLETEMNRSTRSSSHDQYERTVIRPPSTVQLEMPVMGSQNSHASPPPGPVRLPSGPLHTSKPNSPSAHPLSSLSSPRTLDHFPPVFASPRSMALQREAFFEASSGNLDRDSRGFADSNRLYHGPAYQTEPSHKNLSAIPSSHPYGVHYQPSQDLPPRRSIRVSTRLPPLNHEDTTLSSESSHSSRSIPLASLPEQPLPLDTTKTYRMLPQPIPNIGPLPTPLDRPPPSLVPHDYRSQGSLAALLRAGELAAKLDDEMMGETSP